MFLHCIVMLSFRLHKFTFFWVFHAFSFLKIFLPKLTTLCCQLVLSTYVLRRMALFTIFLLHWRLSSFTAFNTIFLCYLVYPTSLHNSPVTPLFRSFTSKLPKWENMKIMQKSFFVSSLKLPRSISLC